LINFKLFIEASNINRPCYIPQTFLHKYQSKKSNLLSPIHSIEISTLAVESQIHAMNVHSPLPIANFPSDNKY